MNSDNLGGERVESSGVNRRAFVGLGAAAGTAVVLSGLTVSSASAAASSPPLATGQDSASAQAAASSRSGNGSRGFQVSAQALGVNTTSGDPNFADAVVPGLLKAAGIGRIRYPGGSGADSSNWMQPTGALPWPEFMGLLNQIGAAPMITVDYGTLTQGP
jgi:hypothetical protein